MSHGNNADQGQLDSEIRKKLGWGPINAGVGIRANFHCEYCNACLINTFAAYYSWEIDHITPKGGDDQENCALSCKPCNHLKHDYRPIGETRKDKISDAIREINKRRNSKLDELNALRGMLGLEPIINNLSSP